MIRGTEIGAEYDAIATAIGTKPDSNNGTHTGTATFASATYSGTANVTGTFQLGGVAVSATAAELNALDGITATTAELNILDGVTATTAELNILDGVTATATELNLVDGLTATTAELNFVDGVTSNIQTQLNTKAPIESPTFTGTTIIPSVNINGGFIDGTTIGVTTPASGTFTTLTANTSLAGTLSTAAQPNVTSVGTLTGFTSTGIDDNATSTAITIDASEQVGIGVTDPSTLLDVRGTTSPAADTGKAGQFVVGGSAGIDNVLTLATAGNGGAGRGSALVFNAGGSTNSVSVGRIVGLHEAATSTPAAPALSFQYATGASTFTEAMRIDSDGNVGIGTTSPSALLDVAGGDAEIHGLTVGRGGGSDLTNVASGVQALLSNTTGNRNTANGYRALYNNTEGIHNTASGFSALLSNTTGNGNTASGFQALYSNTTGNSNTASGRGALLSNTTGIHNTASGRSALRNNTEGSGNIGIGGRTAAGAYSPVFDPTTEDNRVVMGSTAVTNAYVQVSWTVVSDARDKTDFAPVPHGLEFVSQLSPTTYRYKENREDTEGHGPLRYGFKAQDVLALEGDNPVIVDADDPEKLRFNDQAMIAVLVNAIKDLKEEVEELKRGAAK